LKSHLHSRETNFSILQMAITSITNCLGPPPLPPGKRFLQKPSKQLSSTYKSFCDPSVEIWLPHGIPENLMAKLYLHEITMSKIGTNQNLFRSCSEGNLRARETTVLPSTSLNKCIKAIYGSWKNLLYRKCADILYYIHRCNQILKDIKFFINIKMFRDIQIIYIPYYRTI